MNEAGRRALFLLLASFVAWGAAGCGDDTAGTGDDGGTDEAGETGADADADADADGDADAAADADAGEDGDAADGAGGFSWRPLRVGAGGWLTGLDMSTDGTTRVVRTDTYGAYVWDAAGGQWRQLVTSTSMPAADVDVDKNAGVYEVRVAPSDATRLYLAYLGNVYRSDNRGGSWSRTAFATVPMEPNDGYRMTGQKMAVDPANPDVVYVGTQQDGVFVTVDGGGTWQAVTAIPGSATASGGEYPGHAGLAFDPGSGTTAGRTNVIYASSYGHGVYRSADAGATWSALAGGPSNVSHGKIAADGGYYVTGNDRAAVFRYLGGAWTGITPTAESWDTVLVDPFDASRVVAVRDGGYLDISGDRGATWSGILWGPGHNILVAPDIPWLGWTAETYMSTGDMLFDPVTAGRVWFAEGIGVWYTDLPATPPSAITFTSQSAGIEQLVANEIVAPPGGQPVVASWDRPVFYIADPEVFPATHGPDRENAIVMGWGIDYATTTPSFIVGLIDWWGVEKSGSSTDGGRTWTPFPSVPPLGGAIGGCIAASTPTNIVWVPSNNTAAWTTQDGGATWTAVSAPGVPASGETGWGWAYYLNRHIVAADRVTAGTFYLYNYLTGLYTTTDGGTTWTLAHAGEIAPFSTYNAELRSVPGQAGHLFFSSGQQSGTNPAPNPFMRSTDGGVTWTAVPDVLEVYAFGFGRSAPGGSYPTIFIAGWVDGVYGVWRSDDDAGSWVSLDDFPLGSLDRIKTVEGDKNVYGTVYVGFAGSGYAYGAIRP
jgi:hypothetical protein